MTGDPSAPARSIPLSLNSISLQNPENRRKRKSLIHEEKEHYKQCKTVKRASLGL